MVTDKHTPGNILYSTNNSIYTTDFTHTGTELVTTVQDGNLSVSSLRFDHVDKNTLLILSQDSGKLQTYDHGTKRKKEVAWGNEKVLSFELESESSTYLLLGTLDGLELVMVDHMEFNLIPMPIPMFPVERAEHVHHSARDKMFYAVDKHNELHYFSIHEMNRTNVLASFPRDKAITDMVPLQVIYLVLMDTTDNELLIYNTSSGLHFNITLPDPVSQPRSLMTKNDVIYVGGENSITCLKIDMYKHGYEPVSCIQSLTTTTTTTTPTTTTATLSTTTEKPMPSMKANLPMTTLQTEVLTVTTPMHGDPTTSSTKSFGNKQAKAVSAINSNVNVNVKVNSKYSIAL